MNKKHIIITAIISLVVGIVIGKYALGGQVNSMADKSGGNSGLSIHPGTKSATSSSGVHISGASVLKNKQGDEFDKAYLTEMIDRDQGTIRMADLAPSLALHAEVKTLAQSITTSENAEIAELQALLNKWYAQ